MRKYGWKNQEGVVAVLVGLMLPVLLGFVGLALDVGNLVVTKTKMQNTVDAAVYAGGLKLPDQTQATAQANALISVNKFDPATATITFNQDLVKNPKKYPEINCSMTNNVPTFFMSLLGFSTVPITVTAQGIITASPAGPFYYTIFSGSPSDTLILNGSQTVKGSIHANAKLTINGSSNISGAAEGVKGVRISGSNNIGTVSADTVDHIKITGSGDIGSLTGGASDISMPDYSQQIKDVAAKVYQTDQTFNGAVDIDGSLYVKGNVILNGSIESTGAILADGNITINGSSSISGSNQVCLYSATGNITVNGASFLSNDASAILYAPNGKVTINGSINFQGRIIANKVRINGSGNFNGDDTPITSLPINNHVKLIG